MNAERGGKSDALRGAMWLRHPVFDGCAPLDVFECHDAGTDGTELRNVHMLFRREIKLDAAPEKAVLCLAADDVGKCFVNGRFVVETPQAAYPFAHPYYRLDITRHLQPGMNCLAVHVYYHGLVTRAYNSADNRAGVIAALDFVFPGGERRRVVTDDAWRCTVSHAYPSNELFGYATQFNENIDMRRLPVGWRKPGFDDQAWLAPLTGCQDHVFVPSEALPLEHWRAEPASIEPRDDAWFFDFGQELVGCLRLCVRGDKGQVIRVRCAEELTDTGELCVPMRSNCRYEDHVTLSGNEDMVEFFTYRGFRYVDVTGVPERPDVWMQVRHYPFDPAGSRCRSSEPLVEKLWELCTNGIRMGCQDGMLDCPTREKGQYTGDAYMTAKSHLLLTADATLTRKVILDFQRSQRFDEGLVCIAPGGFRQTLAEWSLLWTPLVDLYHRMTGDTDLVRRVAEAGTIHRLHDWFAGQESDRGLLTDLDRKKMILVDWPASLRGGYDHKATKDGENTVANAFYYFSLCAAARVVAAAGRDGTQFERRAQSLRTAFVQALLDKDRGLFRDGAESTNCSLHANGYALCFGLVPERCKAKVIELIREQRLNCGIYGAPYFIEACYRAGEPELAYDLMITNPDKHSWQEMLRSGATTTMEAWAPELKWNTSWCHPAGATPVYLIVTYLLGLSPAAPGWTRMRVDPRIPSALEHVDIRFAVPQGTVRARFDRDTGYRLEAPEGVEVEVAGLARDLVKVRGRMLRHEKEGSS